MFGGQQVSGMCFVSGEADLSGVDSHTANVLVLNAPRFVSEFACQHFR